MQSVVALKMERCPVRSSLFEKRRIDMEIRDPQEFLRYFGKIHQRTMNVVGAIPPGKVDWGFRPDKFTLGDLVRHIAASNGYMPTKRKQAFARKPRRDAQRNRERIL